MQRIALCRSRRELSNEYFFAKFGFDTAGLPLWYLQFLKIVRSTAAAAESGLPASQPRTSLVKFARSPRAQIAQVSLCSDCSLGSRWEPRRRAFPELVTGGKGGYCMVFFCTILPFFSARFLRKCRKIDLKILSLYTSFSGFFF